MSAVLLCGDSLHIPLADESVQCVVTSPPYWGLRDYGVAGQLGLEKTPEEYVEKLVVVFREIKRVLRKDGTLWLNLGDSYAGSGKGPEGGINKGSEFRHLERVAGRAGVPGLKPKDLAGIPWRVAFALQADGWWLRSDIIWHKPNCMPGSQMDRPTSAHEHMFLLTKSPCYFYDQEAVKVPASGESGYSKERKKGKNTWDYNTTKERIQATGQVHSGGSPETALKTIRDVWSISTQAYKGAHFAVFPVKLVEPCIKAGTSEMGCCPKCGAPWVRVIEHTTATSQSTVRLNSDRNDSGHTQFVGAKNNTTGWQPTCTCDAGATVPCVVLDPFSGSGTTGVVSVQRGRHFVGIDLKAAYHMLAKERLGKVQMLLPGESVAKARKELAV